MKGNVVRKMLRRSQVVFRASFGSAEVLHRFWREVQVHSDDNAVDSFTIGAFSARLLGEGISIARRNNTLTLFCRLVCHGNYLSDYRQRFRNYAETADVRIIDISWTEFKAVEIPEHCTKPNCEACRIGRELRKRGCHVPGEVILVHA